MNKKGFYIQLCYILMNKLSNNHIEITPEEWDKTVGKMINIKHRVNDSGNIEFVTSIDEETH
jgi:hypothetical protein